jgi:hypothetical protein
MMQKALGSIANTDDTTFNRWFPEDVDVPAKTTLDARGYASGVFRQLLQASTTSLAAKEVIKNFVNDKNDYSKEPCGPTTKAYFTASTNTFHFCPAGLALLPRPPTSTAPRSATG